MRSRTEQCVDNHVQALEQILNTPSNLDLLLGSQNMTELRTSFYNIKWFPLPSFYSSAFARRSFFVTWDDGSNYFVKLNQDIAKIRREWNMNRLLLEQTDHLKFRMPEILSGCLSAQTTNKKLCAWLIVDWIDGTALEPTKFKFFLGSIADALRSLHHISVLEIIEHVFQIAPPSRDAIRQHLTEQRLATLRHGEAIADAKLATIFNEIALILESTTELDELSLVHGDFHQNNILLPREPKGGKCLVFIDWEDATIDHPLSDIAHLTALNGAEKGIALLEQYAADTTNSGAQSGYYLRRAVWLLAGVWLARHLRWEKTKVKTVSEKAAICEEMAHLLRSIQ